MSNIFLRAEWRKLAMANYEVDPVLLKRFLPAGTEIDYWNDTCYLSLVAFRFVNTRIKGVRIPWHVNFEEINIRFYVRYKDNDTWKRGVVFISEIVAKPALSLVANTFYNENYITLPTRHKITPESESLSVTYQWKQERWNSFSVSTELLHQAVEAGSEQEFITEHYWGYTKLRGNRSSEYQVDHPRWEIYKTIGYSIDVDFGKLYGTDFGFLQNEKPVSVFLAEGSDVLIYAGRKI